MPVEKLVEMADQSYEEMLYEKAQNLYELAYKKDPMSEVVLESFGLFLISIKNEEYAKKILEQAIVLYPDRNHKKFMEYGGINQGQVAIDSYKKGIEIIQTTVKNQIFFKEIKEMKRDLCQAYCAIAEIYQTDLLQLSDSESNCKAYLLKAFDLDNKNLDVNFQFANFFINKNEIQNSQQYFDFIISEIKRIEKKFIGNKFEVVKKKNKKQEQSEEEVKDEATIAEEELDKTNHSILTYEFKLTLVKVLIEIERYKDASYVLKILLEEDQKDYEVQYMLCLCFYHLKKYKEAVQIIEQLKKKNLSYDSELQSAAAELEQYLQQACPQLLNQNTNQSKNIKKKQQQQQQQQQFQTDNNEGGEEENENDWIDDEEDDEEEDDEQDFEQVEEENEDDWEDEMEIEK